MHLYYLIFLLCVCQAGEGTFLATFSALEVRVFKLYASAGRAELSPNMDYFSGGAGLLPLPIYVPIMCVITVYIFNKLTDEILEDELQYTNVGIGFFWFFFKGCVAECMFSLEVYASEGALAWKGCAI